MPRIDQVISGLAAGAGRSLDLQWPGIVTKFAGSVDNKFTNRIGQDHVSNTPFIWTQTIGAGASCTWLVYKNATVARVRGGGVVGAGMNLYNGGPMGLRPRLGRSPILNTRDPFSAYRVFMTAAFNAIPAADCDYGMELLMPAASGNQLLIAGGVPGFGFIRRAGGSVSIVIRSAVAGALTFQAVEPFFTNFDATEFHTYEIRITSATLNADATAAFLVDSRPIATFAWGAGTILPVYQAAYPQIQTGIRANCENNAEIEVFAFAVQASETTLGYL